MTNEEASRILAEKMGLNPRLINIGSSTVLYTSNAEFSITYPACQMTVIEWFRKRQDCYVDIDDTGFIFQDMADYDPCKWWRVEGVIITEALVKLAEALDE